MEERLYWRMSRLDKRDLLNEGQKPAVKDADDAIMEKKK